MQFKIGLPIEKVIHKNKLKIEIEYMGGDADYFESQTMLRDLDDEGIPELFEYLDRLVKKYKYRGMGGSDTYEEVEGYEEYEDIVCIPIDSDSGNSYKVESYALSYFDENGVECHVTIEK